MSLVVSLSWPEWCTSAELREVVCLSKESVGCVDYAFPRSLDTSQ